MKAADPFQIRNYYIRHNKYLEIAYSSNEYTRNVLRDYLTTNKIPKPKDPIVDSLTHTVAYAFLDKNTRSSTTTNENKGTNLLNCVYT